jgi:hypothetical protein
MTEGLYHRGHVVVVDGDPVEVAAVFCGRLGVVAASERSRALEGFLHGEEEEMAATAAELDRGRWLVLALPLEELRAARAAFPEARLFPLEAAVAAAVGGMDDVPLPTVAVDREREELIFVLVDEGGTPLLSGSVPAGPGEVDRVVLACGENTDVSPRSVVVSFEDPELRPQGMEVREARTSLWLAGLGLVPAELELVLPEEAAHREARARARALRRSMAAASTILLAASIAGAWLWADAWRLEGELAVTRSALRSQEAVLARKEVLTRWARMEEGRARLSPWFGRLLTALPPAWRVVGAGSRKGLAWVELGARKGHVPSPRDERALRRAVAWAGRGLRLTPSQGGWRVEKRAKGR